MVMLGAHRRQLGAGRSGSIQTRQSRTNSGKPRGGLSMEDDERRGAVFGHVRRCGPQEPPLHRTITASSKSTNAGNGA